MRLLRAEPEPALAAVFEFLGLGVNGGLAPDALARIARADAVDPESENGFNLSLIHISEPTRPY